ncbi:MAG: hypothetical protein H8E60_05030, partial [Candidatus Marinimicrobia bacterium]|nr:hypothetical protein [Candidatus Neomarinimicrobiota bacterium]
MKIIIMYIIISFCFNQTINIKYPNGNNIFSKNDTIQIIYEINNLDYAQIQNIEIQLLDQNSNNLNNCLNSINNLIACIDPNEVSVADNYYELTLSIELEYFDEFGNLSNIYDSSDQELFIINNELYFTLPSYEPIYFGLPLIFPNSVYSANYQYNSNDLFEYIEDLIPSGFSANPDLSCLTGIIFPGYQCIDSPNANWCETIILGNPNLNPLTFGVYGEIVKSEAYSDLALLDLNQTNSTYIVSPLLIPVDFDEILFIDGNVSVNLNEYVQIGYVSIIDIEGNLINSTINPLEPFHVNSQVYFDNPKLLFWPGLNTIPYGCNDPRATNYEQHAVIDDNSCVFISGCTDINACNYNIDAVDDDGSCNYVADYYDCDNNCINDIDADSICDELEIPGCMDLAANNYNELATDEDNNDCLYRFHGNVFLNGNNDNSNIEIKFTNLSDNNFESVLTTQNGAYSVNVFKGNYNISFSKIDYFPYQIDSVYIDQEIELENIILYFRTNLISVPDDFTSIQDAINFSTDGDTILVNPDTYYENIDFSGKDIILTSNVLIDDQNCPDVSSYPTIDGLGITSVVTYDNGESNLSLLYGFSIENGSANDGGGIYIKNSSPRIICNNIEGNHAYSNGGGIFKEKGRHIENSLIQNNIIKDNIADNFGGGIYISLASTVLFQNEIIENEAEKGGGIYIVQANPEIIDSKINANSTAGDSAKGAGVYLARSNAKFINVEIKDNSGPNDFAVYIFCSDPYFVKTSIYNNSASGVKLSCDEGDIDHQLSSNIDHYISYPIFNSSYIYDNTEYELTTSTNSNYGDNSFSMYYTNIDGGCPYLADFHGEYCDDNTDDFGNCSSDPANCLNNGDSNLPLDSDNSYTNIGYDSTFNWTSAEIWNINFDYFSNLIWEIQFNMPGIESYGYLAPTENELNAWESIINQIKNNPTNVNLINSDLDNLNYELIYDNPDYPDGYYIIKEQYPIQKGWGTFVYNSNSYNNLQVHVNHPIFDFNTHIIGSEAFQELDAQWFLMAGTHRYANCPNNQDNCENYCESDMARNENSIFQRVFETAFDGCDYILSIHAFSGASHSSASFVNLTHGSTECSNEDLIVENITDEYCSQISNFPGSTCCHTSPLNDCDNLGGTENPQGLFINNTDYYGQWIQAELDVDLTSTQDAYTMFIDNSYLFFQNLANLNSVCLIDGCPDINACNYNQYTTNDDGSCYYSSQWCLDLDLDLLGDSTNTVG